MELGLMVEPQVGGSYARLRELVLWAEDQGLDAFARSDHYLDQERSAPTTDALTTFGGLSEITDTIQLVVLVTPITFRHPAVIAKTATTLDEMTGGRFALGVGTGWMQAEHEMLGMDLPELGERFDRLYETLSYLRAAFGTNEGFSGDHYRLAPIGVLPRPVNVPIVIGGSGMKKTPAYAGRFADEYNMFVTDRETLERRLDVMRTAAADADRDPGAVKVSLAGPALVTATDDQYTALLEERGSKRDMSAVEYESFLAERNVPRGTPDQAAAVIAELEAVGVGRFYLQQYTHLEDVDTEALAPVFKALRG
ncbi:MAG: LLM class flavin-dependent oxidoreductase [Acidimicrobiia bacterium]|nr:LLM class flavin-dependent oxidoreductase [Acidimicrobiia bacterium]